MTTARRQLSFIFTAHGFSTDEAGKAELSPEDRKWKKQFDEDRWETLYFLGFENISAGSPSFLFLHRLASAFVNVLLTSPLFPFLKGKMDVSIPEEDVERILQALPYGPGVEWVDEPWIQQSVDELNRAFHRDFDGSGQSPEDYLKSRRKDAKIPDRIYFHLVEDTKNGAYPFAFLATYATFDENGKARQMPLSYALKEYKGDRSKLLYLFSSLDKAVSVLPPLGKFVEDGTMLHPFGVTADEAYDFLKSVPALEEKGIYCRIPNWWKNGRHRPSVTISMGAGKPEGLGLDAILSLRPELIVDGVKLTKKEIRELLAQSEGLAFLKGKWIEVDHDRLTKLLKFMEKGGDKVSFREALKLSASSENGELTYLPGAWMKRILHTMKDPASIRAVAVPKTLKASLRPYQNVGFRWLYTLASMGFGMCLADDMGLGKTIEVLAYLEKVREKHPAARALLVVPASLLGNWEREIRKFAPSLPFTLLHGQKKAAMEEMASQPSTFLTITTYGMALRLEGLKRGTWDMEILDEAQAIKNPGTRQARAVKAISARIRLAMTGTPVENSLSNLWSLFDFLNPGLLGSRLHFTGFVRELANRESGYEPLKRMIAPFILRRLKTDKSIINDLPEKTEIVEYVPLSARQAALYGKELDLLAQSLRETKSDGIQRKGLVLTAISKLKQICNHPDEFLGSSRFRPEDSGKFIRLREICEALYEKREPVLVFTQYREMVGPLCDFLASVFGMPGLSIHGGTPVKKRMELVDEFNGEKYIPFMVLSLKAAGTGLNLTKAGTVIHFDRWWNPAVENQATDRAYRIGQKQHVMVYKFVSQGTIEEKINDMMEDKKQLAEEIIDSGVSWITELSDKELLDLLKLDGGEGDDSHGLV